MLVEDAEATAQKKKAVLQEKWRDHSKSPLQHYDDTPTNAAITLP
jgi:hypothetical protein